MLTSLVASVLVTPHTQQPIHAYLDPGTGSLVLQATLAAVLSVPFILRSRISALHSRLTGKHQAALGSRGNHHA